MKDIKEFFESKQVSAELPITEAFGPNTIYFKNASAFAIYLCELLGQVSDGYWENSRPSSHWKWIGDTKPVIDKDKEGYTGPQHRIKYSIDWLRRYVKKALNGNGGNYDWTIRVFKYGKMASVTPDSLIQDLTKDGYDAWRSIAEALPEEEVNNEQLGEAYAKSDYRKKYWEKTGKKYFTDELLKKYYNSKYGWSEFEDDLESAGDSMNTQIK